MFLTTVLSTTTMYYWHKEIIHNSVKRFEGKLFYETASKTSQFYKLKSILHMYFCVRMTV